MYEATKLLIAGLFLALICVAMRSSLSADEHDQATQLTFNEAVEIPGQVLAAGTYWFTLMELVRPKHRSGVVTL